MRPSRIFMAVALSAVVLYLAGSVGDLRGASGWRVRLHSRESFDPVGWRSGNAALRGGMLRDLMKRERFRGIHRDRVRTILGKSDCYHIQDGWPCYSVQLGKRDYQLAFVLNDPDAPGHVSTVYLAKR